MIQFDYDDVSETLTCRLVGHMDSGNCADVASGIEKWVARLGGDAGPEGDPRPERLKIVFDLEKVEFVSSVFLRVVLMTVQQVRPGDFSIVNTSPFVTELFRTAGLDHWLAAPGETERPPG